MPGKCLTFSYVTQLLLSEKHLSTMLLPFWNAKTALTSDGSLTYILFSLTVLILKIDLQQ